MVWLEIRPMMHCATLHCYPPQKDPLLSENTGCGSTPAQSWEVPRHLHNMPELLFVQFYSDWEYLQT